MSERQEKNTESARFISGVRIRRAHDLGWPRERTSLATCQTISQSGPSRGRLLFERVSDSSANGLESLSSWLLSSLVRFANSSKLRSSRALPAGHPGHLISFVETDREAYSLSIYSYRGVDGRTRDCRTRACMCIAKRMRCDATRTPPWPCRFDALQSRASQLSGTRMRESHCSHKPPVRPHSDKTTGNAGEVCRLPCSESLTRLLTTRH